MTFSSSLDIAIVYRYGDSGDDDDWTASYRNSGYKRWYIINCNIMILVARLYIVEQKRERKVIFLNKKAVNVHLKPLYIWKVDYELACFSNFGHYQPFTLIWNQ